MSWNICHSKSEQYASEAEIALGQNEHDRALYLYSLAAEQETLALDMLDQTKPRTLGITAVSATALWYKSKNFQRAEQVAYICLSKSLPDFAAEQLKGLLQLIWNEKDLQQVGVEFARGEVLVSVSGGNIIRGGAPLDLIILKVDQIGRTFYRVIEMLLGEPFRVHGAPKPEIRDQFRPWLFQAPAGSYQFAVRVERPRQLALPFSTDVPPDVELITQKFLDIVRTSAEDPEGKLPQIVPDEQYRNTFLKLTRNLIPTGKTFGRLEIKSPGAIQTSSIVLLPESREVISTSLRRTDESRKAEHEPQSIQLQGTLRAVHLDKDWLELHIGSGDNIRTVRIDSISEAIDDLIGPMVNRPVIVDVVEKTKGKYLYRDIQIDE